jgi:hypothetical protein
MWYNYGIHMNRPTSQLVAENVGLTTRSSWSTGNEVGRIASFFGVGRATVRSILERKNWKHVPEDE